MTVETRHRTPTMALMKRLYRESVGQYRGQLVLAAFFMALSAAATAAVAKLMEPVVNEVFMLRNAALLWPVAGMVLATFATKGIAEYGQSVVMARVGLRIIADLQQRLFGHLMTLDAGFFARNTTGRLVSRFLVDINQMRNAVSNALTSLGKDMLSVIGLVTVMFWQDWLLATVAFFVFPVAILPIARIGRRMRKVSINTQDQMGAFNTVLEQSFHGIRMVKSYGLEGHECSKIRALTEDLFSLAFKASRIRAMSSPVMETLGGIAITVVILYGGSRVVDGTTTAGQFFSFITALMLAYQPMKNLAKLNASLEEGLAGAERLFSILDTRTAITERADAIALKTADGQIEFRNVSFSYNGQKAVLSGLNLVVPPGKTVALVGPSGAGKSTILNLIPRFYDVASGAVLIDGLDVRQATLDSLRQSVALVSQEVVLFDDTIRANIAFGKPDANETEIEHAARLAAAHDFISALPMGYATPVGERGMSLSGGQRQRIAIARAILKNAPVLLLDEATSALDTESERQVQDALQTLMQGRTTVVIAHRLSTITQADLIHVIDEGRVIEHGTHQDLLERGGAYAALYALQFRDTTEPGPSC
ncbi:lipid A export permease/ATP-binding protein MsbA [Haematospirillum jordaniae]|uniref:lipid A export permease/ATP-binding protein MsbA n=1 Tax=Haematospirillum jordaniae TaxID=1549855 RepID=UPI002AC32E31|nr:lipid A export permease/ATP-binding protein MsbA [Haematospirillum jordaniae]